MSYKDIPEKVEGYILEYFNENAFELCDIEFVKEGPNWYLRIYADKEGGITINDCEAISKKTESILDEKDIIEQAYILEVSSPGIDRPLKKASDYEKYKDEIVDVKLYKAVDGLKEFQGKLLGLDNGIVLILLDDGIERRFALKDIAICRLAVIF